MKIPTKKEYEQFANETWNFEACCIIEVDCPQKIIDNKKVGTWVRKNNKILFQVGYEGYVTELEIEELEKLNNETIILSPA